MWIRWYGRITSETMATVDPSTPLPDSGVTAYLFRTGAYIRTVVRGFAFWASIPLPVAIVTALLAGAAPLFVVALFVMNVVCAVLGHSYSPRL